MAIVKWGPWLHAFLVAGAAAALYVAERWTGGAWVAVVLVLVSRGLGAFVASVPKWRQPRRRGTVREDLAALRRETATIAAATHGINNKLAVVIGEVDLLIARMDVGER